MYGRTVAAVIAAVVILAIVGVERVSADLPVGTCNSNPACFNFGTCTNATSLDPPVERFHCTCLPSFCGDQCQTPCPYVTGKAAWMVRATGVSTSTGVEISGGLTELRKPNQKWHPLWAGTSYSTTITVGNQAFTQTGGGSQVSDSYTVAIDPDGMYALNKNGSSPSPGCLCNPFPGIVPEPTPWGFQSTGNGPELSTGIAAASVNSIAITSGVFLGPDTSFAGLTGQTFVNRGGNAGTADFFLVATNTDTHARLWATTGGGAGTDSIADIAMSGADTAQPWAIVAGDFNQNMTWDGREFIVSYNDPSVSTQPKDVFWARVNPFNGQVVDAVSGGGGGHDAVYGVAVDNSTRNGGISYIVGDYQSSNFSWPAGNIVYPYPKSMMTGFLLIVNETGGFQTFLPIENCLNGTSRITAVATVANGTRVVVAGQYSCSNLIFAGRNGPTRTQMYGELDLFIFSLSFDSAWVPTTNWAYFGGGVNDDMPAAIAIEPKTYATFLVGTFYSPRFRMVGPARAPQPLVLDNYNGPNGVSGNSQAFVIKFLDSDGLVSWAAAGGGGGNDYATDVTVQPGLSTAEQYRTSVFVAGEFNSAEFIFGNLTVNGPGLGSGGDGFVVGFDEHDDCVPQPCQNGGVCVDLANDFFCACPPDHNTNKICGYDACISNPCMNGARCVNEVNAYSCVCVTGFTGTICQTNIDDCLNAPPCANGGTCVDQVNGFTCACVVGFQPPDCNEIDHCPGHDCGKSLGPQPAGQGYCHNILTPPLWECVCNPGYTGSGCQTEINECAVQPPPCHSGTCIDGIASFSCICPQTTNGTYCQFNITTSSTGTFEPSSAHRVASATVTAATLIAALITIAVVTVAGGRWQPEL